MTWNPGTLVSNRYELRLMLPEGGMADVWLARDVTKDEMDPDAPVVLKCLHKDLQVTRLLFEEFEHVITLHHRNIIKVFDVQEHQGTPFISMEYLRGKDLSRVIGRVAELSGRGVHEHYIIFCARIISQICQALACAHSDKDSQGNPKQRIIHRDISPHNIVLMIDGGVKLIDFGIARALEELSHITRSPIWGKTMYMPPEAWLHQGVNERSDIFSLGVVMFDLLTGDNLFYSRKAAMERPEDLTRPVTRLESQTTRLPFNPNLMGLAKGLDNIVLTALQIDPAKRFPSATNMGHEIDLLLKNNGYDWIGNKELGEFMCGLFRPELEDVQQWPQGLHAGYYRTIPEVAQVLRPKTPKTPLPPAWALIAVVFVVLMSWTGLMLAARKPLQLKRLPPPTDTAVKHTYPGEPLPVVRVEPRVEIPKPKDRTKTKRRPWNGTRGHPPAVPGKAKTKGACALQGNLRREIAGILAAVRGRQFSQLKRKLEQRKPLLNATLPPELANLKTIINRDVKVLAVVCPLVASGVEIDGIEADANNYPGVSIPDKKTLDEKPRAWCSLRTASVVARLGKYLSDCAKP